MALDSLLETLLGKLQSIAKTDTIVGAPVTVGGTIIIPISKVSIGFGAGSGDSRDGGKEGGGQGTGGGVTVTPVAVLIVIDGKAQLIPMDNKDGLLSKAIDLVPEMFDKVAALAKKDGATTPGKDAVSQKES